MNKNLSRNIKKLKKEKITAGIDADCNKITKILKLLYAPLTIFLILVDPHWRYSFYRVLVSITYCHGNMLNLEACDNNTCEYLDLSEK